MENTAAIQGQIAQTYDLFKPIRERFTGAGVERGGIERVGVTPLYVKKYGEHIALIYPEVDRFSVESSFSEEQLRLVNEALLALKDSVMGKTSGLALSQRTITHYRESTRPYFMLAMLKGVEDVVREAVMDNPQLVAAFDAIFRVAGSEGIRDLVRMYCAHHLEKALENAQSPMPDMLAFVDVHQRETHAADGTLQRTQYEVWCPGTDLAKTIFRQCEQAARELVEHQQATFALSIQEEVSMMPFDVTQHMNRLIQTWIVPILRSYGVQ